MPELKATRYLTAENRSLATIILEELPYWDFDETVAFYNWMRSRGSALEDLALLGANDRYFLLTGLLRRPDALHPWLFERCREVEAKPDDHLDLWAREHYKSTIITFAGTIQEIVRHPEITIAIFAWAKHIATKFVGQIKLEAENNEILKLVYPDVFWWDPKKESPLWSVDKGLIFKRRGNPKEATLEGHGLIDGQPTSRHFDLRIYDDVVTRDNITTPEQVKKTTEGWELSDNLAGGQRRRWHTGTRYIYGDTYGVILERGILTPRLYPATSNGRKDGVPVLWSPEVWEQKKRTQVSTLAAQLLQNPLADGAGTFKINWLRPWLVRPATINVYILVDPSKGRKNRKQTSDRTAIAVIAIDAAGTKYLVDGACHRMTLSQRWDMLKMLHRKWEDMPGVQMLKVGYEQYGMQTDLEHFESKMLDAQDDRDVFAIEEVNWPHEGGHSKKERVERLQPDFEYSDFLLPGIVHHEALDACYWSVNPETNKIDYRPVQGSTKLMRAAEVTGQGYRVCSPLKRLDEDKRVYDVTKLLMEEMLLFPFGIRDDMVDAVSRVYDLDPQKAEKFDSAPSEPVYYRDS